MAKDKKIDYSKLTLGAKKRAVKKSNKEPQQIDEVVRKIHHTAAVDSVVSIPNATTAQNSKKKSKSVPTKRITLDIPIPLHAEIRKKTFDMGITMKKYFLDLAQKHLNEAVTKD